MFKVNIKAKYFYNFRQLQKITVLIKLYKEKNIKNILYKEEKVQQKF